MSELALAASCETRGQTSEHGELTHCVASFYQTTEEQDVFDSDFGSTDSGSGEEEDGDGEDAGERKLQREAKEARKVSSLLCYSMSTGNHY